MDPEHRNQMICNDDFSFLLQQNQGSTQVSKGDLCNDHLYAIASVFSGIFLVNYVLMNSAANVFYSTGLDLLTFQDALSLMDQVTELYTSFKFISANSL